MRKDRLKCLVDEYRLAQERLSQIRGEQVKAELSAEILKVVEKDLKEELEKAKTSKDESALSHWQAIIGLLSEDKDCPHKEELEKSEKKISPKQEKLIIYYERKLKSIRKLLGDRLVEILEGYAEKNILIGGGSSSESSFSRVVDKEEAEEEIRQRQQKKRNINFDKM